MPFPKYPVPVESKQRPYGEPSDAYIGLGANLGDRELNLRVAREELGNLGDVTGESCSIRRITACSSCRVRRFAARRRSAQACLAIA